MNTSTRIIVILASVCIAGKSQTIAQEYQTLVRSPIENFVTLHGAFRPYVQDYGIASREPPS